MHSTPTPDDRTPEQPCGPSTDDTRSAAGRTSTAVPRQWRASPHDGRLPGPGTDPLEHPDPHRAARAAAVENLLRCWVRETGLTAPDGGVLRIPLPASGTALLVPVLYWSPTGWHRFGPPRLGHVPEPVPPVDAVLLAALLGRESTGIPKPAPADPAALGPTAHDPAAAPGPLLPTPVAGPESGGLPPASAPEVGDATDLASCVADSLRRVAAFLTDRRKNPADVPDLFLAAEQALLLGHPLHPAPKSREGLSDAEARRYSPEVRGSFPLHWMAVAPSLLVTDSAWTERGRRIPAPRLTARLAGPGLPLPDGYAALPVHPWQLREIRHRTGTAALLDAGLLRDLGSHGTPWHPTSSVRTVHRADAPAMLKLSLGLRITNSRRENLRKELHRGVEVHRLLRTGLARQWRAVHPGFDIVRDPAWLAVDGPAGDPVPGLDVVIRHNPFRPHHDVACVAGLVSPRPCPRPGTGAGPTAHAAVTDTARNRAGTHTPVMGSRLAELVTRLTVRTGRSRDAVAAEWFLRYLEHVVRPVLWLDGEAGIALEAHQQNTLLLLDTDGWPAGGRYRDNQGYYFRESRRAELDARLPGIGEHSDTFVSDEVTDERFAYYLAVNNVFGLVGAFGSQRLADERLLLAAFRRFLTAVSSGPARTRSSLPARLLDSPVLRCKANMLTRLHGLDELVGPVDTQSVYVTIANPLHS
ncbi:iron transporter [Streptomyces sp. NWU49]|uniref:IucA/IucC family protein n=1 Tax=Streptomyces sp. NWU49 TaxID=2201153 RepID=UPI000D6799FA|nr:IucA/IucC family protein [Streptomyces sp. NWU49]PWJ04546.1 iron transporter [Streptomyces sp. NWU49]